MKSIEDCKVLSNTYGVKPYENYSSVDLVIMGMCAETQKTDALEYNSSHNVYCLTTKHAYDKIYYYINTNDTFEIVGKGTNGVYVYLRIIGKSGMMIANKDPCRFWALIPRGVSKRLTLDPYRAFQDLHKDKFQDDFQVDSHRNNFQDLHKDSFQAAKLIKGQCLICCRSNTFIEYCSSCRASMCISCKSKCVCNDTICTNCTECCSQCYEFFCGNCTNCDICNIATNCDDCLQYCFTCDHYICFDCGWASTTGCIQCKKKKKKRKKCKSCHDPITHGAVQCGLCTERFCEECTHICPYYRIVSCFICKEHLDECVTAHY